MSRIEVTGFPNSDSLMANAMSMTLFCLCTSSLTTHLILEVFEMDLESCHPLP